MHDERAAVRVEQLIDGVPVGLEARHRRAFTRRTGWSPVCVGWVTPPGLNCPPAETNPPVASQIPTVSKIAAIDVLKLESRAITPVDRDCIGVVQGDNVRMSDPTVSRDLPTQAERCYSRVCE
jgi:hypothetical protein